MWVDVKILSSFRSNPEVVWVIAPVLDEGDLNLPGVYLGHGADLQVDIPMCPLMRRCIPENWVDQIVQGIGPFGCNTIEQLLKCLYAESDPHAEIIGGK